MSDNSEYFDCGITFYIYVNHIYDNGNPLIWCQNLQLSKVQCPLLCLESDNLNGGLLFLSSG